MRESDAGSLLATYYEGFLRDHDIEIFRQQASARYTEGTLMRLVESGNVTARRAAVLALGLFGTFQSNAAVARALRDSDPTVRNLADNALWAIWFRADTPENNRALVDVIAAVGRGELSRAEALATRLIVAAPRFAEAYNQRAIIAFEQGRFDDAARDCRRVLELNPFHFGAMSGLAQCEVQLGRPAQAIETLRRAARLQPYNPAIREHIRRIAARMALDASR